VALLVYCPVGYSVAPGGKGRVAVKSQVSARGTCPGVGRVDKAVPVDVADVEGGPGGQDRCRVEVVGRVARRAVVIEDPQVGIRARVSPPTGMRPSGAPPILVTRYVKVTGWSRGTIRPGAVLLSIPLVSFTRSMPANVRLASASASNWKSEPVAPLTIAPAGIMGFREAGNGPRLGMTASPVPLVNRLEGF
jgi:hypothetical protein